MVANEGERRADDDELEAYLLFEDLKPWLPIDAFLQETLHRDVNGLYRVEKEK